MVRPKSVISFDDVASLDEANAVFQLLEEQLEEFSKHDRIIKVKLRKNSDHEILSESECTRFVLKQFKANFSKVLSEKNIRLEID